MSTENLGETSYDYFSHVERRSYLCANALSRRLTLPSMYPLRPQARDLSAGVP